MLGYIDGTIIEPDVSDPRHAEWKTYSVMVMFWMLNSMEPEVSEGWYQSDTAKEVWDTLHDLYANKIIWHVFMRLGRSLLITGKVINLPLLFTQA